MRQFNDLHCHLYGCLEIEDLYWMASNNQPRWNIFENSWKKTYGYIPDIKNLFESEINSNQRLREFYYPENPGSFEKFQASFDLVISLASTNKAELEEITKRIIERQVAAYCEYKMMFSPLEKKENYQMKLLALCKAMQKHQTKNRSCQLIMSISRDKILSAKHYSWIKELQSKNEIAHSLLAGIDFCSTEEGYPPEFHNSIINQIVHDNSTDPKNALIITYHVGESFQDKSVEAAIRWIVEAAMMGCHRLGHALALGIPTDHFKNTKRKESSYERKKMLNFLQSNLSELHKSGFDMSSDELKNLLHATLKQSQTIEIYYDDRQIKNLESIQNWAMQKIKQSGVVIETCPTSNLYIGNLKPEHHPLKRFLDANLNIIIGSDDGGILKTDIKKEFQKINTWKNITNQDINKLISNGRKFTAQKILKKYQ